MSIEDQFGAHDIEKLGQQAEIEMRQLEERKNLEAKVAALEEDKKLLEARIARFEERLRAEEAEKKAARAEKTAPTAYSEKAGLTPELRTSIEAALAEGNIAEAWDKMDHLIRYDPKLRTLLNFPSFEDEVLKVYGRYFRRKGAYARRTADATIPHESLASPGSTTIGVPGGMGRLAMLFIDLDDFKKLNDTKGHFAGDAALRKVAEVLSEGLREADIKGRFGGEELVVAIETENEFDHFRVAEKIRRLIEASTVEYAGEKIKVTASIGAAELLPGETFNQLVDRANWAMKYAKAHGKNKAVPGDMTEVVEWVAEHRGGAPAKKVTFE